MTLAADVLETLEAVEPEVEAWDALAQRAGRPYCAPGWLLPWWRNVAPAGALLRIVVARDSEGLAGLAPFYAHRERGLWTYRMLGTSVSARVEPLVRPDVATEATNALVAALAQATPTAASLVLDGVPADADWAGRIRAAWPGRPPFAHRRGTGAAPTATLGKPDLDSWLAERSSNFRQQMRRYRRKLEKAGAVHRVTDSADAIPADLAEFERLHRGRHDPRGGTDAFPPGAAAMLAEAGRELLPEKRFLLASIEIDGRVISSHLFVSAGDEMSFWNSGFDDEFADLRPSHVGLMDGVAAGIAAGRARFDLGQGTQSYKYRFADAEDDIESVTVVPVGARYAPARAAYAPQQARYALATRLSDEQKEKIRGTLARIRRRSEPAA